MHFQGQHQLPLPVILYQHTFAAKAPCLQAYSTFPVPSTQHTLWHQPDPSIIWRRTLCALFACSQKTDMLPDEHGMHCVAQALTATVIAALADHITWDALQTCTEHPQTESQHSLQL